ncbi:hypothetical protein N2152v2_000517 [Parachlorella kessleri]
MDAPSPSFAELPEDTLAVILRAALPPPDEDGFLPSRAVASACRALSCCKAWRRALQRLLAGMEAPHDFSDITTGGGAGGVVAQAPGYLPKGGFWLLCSASDAELKWLGTPWLPLAAAKFTHQLDRQSLCWEHGIGYAARPPGFEGGCCALPGVARRHLVLAAAAQQGEEGLEARHKPVLESLPRRALSLLFLDFVDGPANLWYLPLRCPPGGTLGAPLGLLRLRCAGDLWLGSEQQARVRSVAARRLWLEAPRIGIALERLIGEGSSGGNAQPGSQAGGWEGRLLSALELVAGVAADMVVAASHSPQADLPPPPPAGPPPEEAQAAAAATTAASPGPALGGCGEAAGCPGSSGGAVEQEPGTGCAAGGLAALALDEGSGSTHRHSCGAAAGGGPCCLLHLVFKDLALLQVSPACTIRVSLLQLLQNAGLKHVSHSLPGTAVSLLPLAGRRFWWQLEVMRSIEDRLSLLTLVALLGAWQVWDRLNRAGLHWSSSSSSQEQRRGELPLEVPLSSIECDRAPWATRTCRVRQLYVAGQMAVFVATDANMSLPEVRVWEYAESPKVEKPQWGPTIPLSKLLRVVSQEEAAALFAARLAQGPQGNTAAGASMGSGEAPPDAAAGPLNQGDGDPGAPAVVAAAGGGYRALGSVVALQPFLLNNWWHTMDDVVVTGFRFCKYFGRCRYEDLRSAASGVALINAQPFSGIPSPVKEAFSCYGSLLRLERMPADQLQQEAAKPLVVIRELLLGVGDEITHPYMAKPLRLRRASDAMRLQQIEVLRQCAGLPQESPPRAVPNLRIVNREYGAGRSMLGLAEVLAVLDKRRPSGLPFNVEVVYPTGFNFTQQARLFDGADILMIGHGAAAGNMIFLPRRAVVLNLAALDLHRGQEGRVVEGLPKPAFQVTYVKVFGDSYTEPIVDKLRTHDGFLALPPEDQAHLLLHPQKNDTRTLRIVRQLFQNWHWAMFYFVSPGSEEEGPHGAVGCLTNTAVGRAPFYGAVATVTYIAPPRSNIPQNIRAPTAMLAEEILKAVRLWYEKQQQEAPAAGWPLSLGAA